MTTPTPILTTHLFRPLETKLIELLRSFSPEDWQTQALPKWTVKDVAAHLLDTSLRRLSIGRDRYFGESFTGSGDRELVEFLNGLNADWVKTMRRVSPSVLVRLIEHASQELAEYLESLDPNAPAPFPVSWAGDVSSPNWFDIAREYTERWHHQQQIREAVSHPGIMDRELYAPVLETFMLALPYSYRDIASPVGTTVRVRIEGDAGGTWYLRRKDDWQLLRDGQTDAAAEITVPDKIAWKIFTQRTISNELRSQIQIRGDAELASHFCDTLAVVM